MLERLKALHPKRIDLSLNRVHYLLKKLSNPEKNLPPVVHIAGTNGKGSVLAHLRAMIEAAGYKVHTYTSPHLVKFNERICIAGKTISDRALVALLEECEAANLDQPMTFFEITTVAAILKFSRAPADIVLLETGLGGRLDATNVIEKPILSLITPISLDHQQFLGNSIEQITLEKAGILKPGVACVVGPQPQNAIKVIEDRAKKIGASLFRFGIEWSIEEENLPPSALLGEHQRINSTMAAIAAVKLKNFTIQKKHIFAGLKTVNWPARMQKLRTGNLINLLPVGWELWLDGGHNQAAAQVISVHAATVWNDRPLYLVIGMINSKNPENFLRLINVCAKNLWFVPIPNEGNSLTTSELTASAHAVGIFNVHETISVRTALEQIILVEKKTARILICGSLYLAGSVLENNN